MSAGGLTGAGGGSIAGSTPPPLAKQPDGASLISYAQAGSPKPDGSQGTGSGGKNGADAKAGHVGDGWAQSEEQSQKLQDFDAVRGRPSLGDERQGDRQENEEQEGSFVGCAAGAAKDVVVDTVKGTYETVKDAGGAVLDKVGVDGYEGHTERTVERVGAVKDGAAKTWEAAKSPIETGGKIVEAGKDELAEIGEEIKNGESCKLGERVGTTVGVVGTVAIPGGAAVKGVKVLAKMGGKDGADGPEAKDAGKTEEATNSPQRDIEVSDKQAQKKFKHASGLGVEGSYNQKKGKEFAEKIEEFVKDENHQRVDGHYQGKPATIYVDPGSRQAVVVKPDGQYWTNWTLSEKQFEHVIKDGKLGGN